MSGETEAFSHVSIPDVNPELSQPVILNGKNTELGVGPLSIVEALNEKTLALSTICISVIAGLFTDLLLFL